MPNRRPRKAGDSFVTAEYLLLALTLAAGTEAAKILKDAGVTAQGPEQGAIAGSCARAAPPIPPRRKMPMTR